MTLPQIKEVQDIQDMLGVPLGEPKQSRIEGDFVEYPVQSESAPSSILVHTEGGNEVVVGVFTLNNGVESFVAREENVTEAANLAELLKSVLTTEQSVDAPLFGRIKQSRQLLFERGILSKPSESKPFKVPEDFKAKSTSKRSAVVDSGSHEKTLWRGRMVESALNFLGKEIRAIDNKAMVLLPGLSEEEIQLWHELCGFKISDMVAIESLSEVATKLENNIGKHGASVVNRKLGGQKRLGKNGLSSVAEETIDALDGRPVHILSFDTENNITKSIVRDISQIMANANLADKVFVSLNFVGSREQQSQWNFLNEIMEGAGEKIKGKNIGQYRAQALGTIMQYALTEAGLEDEFTIDNITLRTYTGHSGTPMIYGFYNLIRK